MKGHRVPDAVAKLDGLFVSGRFWSAAIFRHFGFI